MFTVYRLEHESGMGPYQVDDYDISIFSLVDEAVHTDDLHPELCEDFPDSKNNKAYLKHLCACPSFSSLKEWFQDCWDKLLENGYSVYKITIENIVMGLSGRQCFYREENVITKEIIY